MGIGLEDFQEFRLKYVLLLRGSDFCCCTDSNLRSCSTCCNSIDKGAAMSGMTVEFVAHPPRVSSAPRFVKSKSNGLVLASFEVDAAGNWGELFAQSSVRASVVMKSESQG